MQWRSSTPAPRFLSGIFTVKLLVCAMLSSFAEVQFWFIWGISLAVHGCIAPWRTAWQQDDGVLRQVLVSGSQQAKKRRPAEVKPD